MKDQLGRLQQYHGEIEGRSDVLEGQLTELRERYAGMGEVCRQMEAELGDLREVVRKTEEERAFVHTQKEQM